MKLKVEKKFPNLRVHNIINKKIIASSGYSIFEISINNEKIKLNTIPNQFIKKILSKSRILSRGFRLGISQIKKTFDDMVLIFCNGALILSDFQFSDFKYLNVPIRCFQLMDHNICTTDDFVYYSEYFPNKKRDKVYIYRSEDAINWKVIYTFPARSIKHVHVLQKDPYEDIIWFSTGDLNSESMLGFTDYDFSKLHILGKGEQKWRSLEFQFTEDKVYWGMDSEFEESYLIEFDRNKRQKKLIKKFDGPIYNFKKTDNGIYLIGTSVDGGPTEKDNRAHIWISRNLHRWEDLISYPKDKFPQVMINGRLLFPENMRDKIIFSGISLKGIDNKLIIGKLI